MSGIQRRWHEDGKPRPYTASATFGGVVWACGQVPTRADGSTPESLRDQVNVVFDNLEKVLADAGADLSSVLKITVFLANLDEFDEYNSAYLARFGDLTLPPRTTVEVSRFRGEKRIEMDAVAAAI
ncbi:RidA family protein [Pseudarthrobacter sp. AL07]|uniref:RidA family protein n=1 Tax=unclassified Pseudarthrobacter TaxID=2647000 RepID=UPI00249C0B31|nr:MULTISPECIES: RidA family protein [unclassified Pseudarthrobacter]MDI3195861.1 RidA family protein [Pseudarthrobacter sp. AL20]MDI3209596.1 RidA family protein [Pseudarthrobacter sp. AL07]